MNIGYNKKNSSLYFLDFILLFYCKWLNIYIKYYIYIYIYILDKFKKNLLINYFLIYFL
jgi:hypothetical protein